MHSIRAGLIQEASPFARGAVTMMEKGSPLLMCVTLHQIQRSATMSLAECLRMERTMVRRCFEQGEILEGVRARVIDKDNNPRWSPATLETVTREMVASFFESAWPPYAHPLRELGQDQAQDHSQK